MAKDHTNIDTDEPYEMPGGKCAAEYKGEDYTKILEGNAPDLDMGSAPSIDMDDTNGKTKKEK